MSEDKIYELLNNVSIEDSDNNEKMSEFEMHKIKKSLKGKISEKKRFKWLPKVAIAAVLVSGFMLTSPGQVLYAKMQRVYDNIMVSMTRRATDPYKMEGIINKPKKQVEDKGILISFEEVLLDGDKINVAIISELLEPEKYTKFDKDKEISVYVDFPRAILDGKNIGVGGRGTSWNLSEKITQTTYEQNIKEKIESDSNLEFIVNQVEITQEIDGKYVTEKVKGEWKFSFAGADLQKELGTKTFKIDKELAKIDGNPVYVDYLRYNDFRIELYLKREKIKDSSTIPVEIVAVDSSGKEYKFETTTDTGDITTMLYTGVDGRELIDQKELTLQLYIQKMPKESGKMPPNESLGDPIKIVLEK